MKLIILKILIAFSLLYWIIKSGKFDFTVLGHLFTFSNITILIFLYFLILIGTTTRWYFVLKFFDQKISWIYCLKLNLIGLFFNFFIPLFGVGGDVLKGYYLTKNKSNKSDFIASIFLDRYFGLLGLLITVIMLLLFVDFLWLPSLILFLVLILLIVMINSKLKFQAIFKYLKLGWVSDLVSSCKVVTTKPKFMSFIIFYSCSIVSLYVIFFAVSGSLMGYESSIWVYLKGTPLTLIASAIPISFGGIGVGQVSALYIFDYFTTEANLGPATVSVFQLTGILVSFVGFVLLKLKD